MAELPLTDRVFKLVLPATVRVLEAAGKATLPVKIAKPLLSMVKRSISWPELELELPVLLVLNTRLPPSLLVASCSSTPSALCKDTRCKDNLDGNQGSRYKENCNRRPRSITMQCCKPGAKTIKAVFNTAADVTL